MAFATREIDASNNTNIINAILYFYDNIPKVNRALQLAYITRDIDIRMIFFSSSGGESVSTWVG